MRGWKISLQYDWGGVLSCSKEKLSRHFGLLSSPNVFQIKGINYKTLVVQQQRGIHVVTLV